MNPTEPNMPAIRQRRPMTEARLKANRENAKKAALSAPQLSMKITGYP
jgi:hypothetical protein